MFLFEKKKLKKKYATAKVPILILDQMWIERFAKKYRNEKITELEEKLRESFKHQARLTETVKKMSQTKKYNLARILELTTEVFNNDSEVAKREMEQLQKEVVTINEDMEKLAIDLESVPLEIDEINMLLLDETVEIAYKKMVESQQRLEIINPRIDELRHELSYLVQEKADSDDTYQNTYTLLDLLVGQEVIDKLDEKNKSKKGRFGNGFGNRNRYIGNKKNDKSHT